MKRCSCNIHALSGCCFKKALSEGPLWYDLSVLKYRYDDYDDAVCADYARAYIGIVNNKKIAEKSA